MNIKVADVMPDCVRHPIELERTDEVPQKETTECTAAPTI